MNKIKTSGLIAFIWIAGIACAYPQQYYTLEECRQIALEQNASMTTARNDLSGAEQTRKEAFSNFFPTVGLEGGGMISTNGLFQMLVGPVKMNMMENGVVGAVTASLPIYTGGRIYAGNKLARIGEEVSELRLEQTENEVMLSVEQYYWQIVSLKEKLHTLEQVVALLERIRIDAETAVDAGIKNRNDLLQVQLRLNDMRSKKSDLENALSLSKMVLAQYIGVEQEGFDIAVLQSASPVSPESLKVEHDDALASTPEYKLLNKNVDAANWQKKMSLGEHLPSVAVGGMYMYNDLMDFSQNTVIGGVSISIPISWKTSFSVKKQKYNYMNAKTRLNDGSEQLMLRMQKAWNDLTNAYEQINIARESVAQSSENLRLNEDYYKAGTSSMSDLLDAQMLYQQSRDKLVETLAQYEIKKTEYLQATGR